MGGGFLAYYEHKKAVPTTPTVGDVPPDKTVDEVPADYGDGGYGGGGGGSVSPIPAPVPAASPTVIPPPLAPGPEVQHGDPNYDGLGFYIGPPREPTGDPNYDGMGFYIGPTGGGPPDPQPPATIDGWSIADHDAIVAYLASHPRTTTTTTRTGYR